MEHLAKMTNEEAEAFDKNLQEKECVYKNEVIEKTEKY